MTALSVDQVERMRRIVAGYDHAVAGFVQSGNGDIAQAARAVVGSAKAATSGGPDACHPWIGATARGGYGTFRVKGIGMVPAPRWLLGHLRGSRLGPSEVACHHCDKPACVNPTHLYVGSHGSNAVDRVARRRDANSVKTHCPKGHPYNAANTYRYSHCGRNTRSCRACNRAAVARRKASRRAEAGAR